MTQVTITQQPILGYMAYWAVRQHPYHRPERLFDILDIISSEASKWPDQILGLSMRQFANSVELEKWLHSILDGHIVLQQWNTPKSGHNQTILHVTINQMELNPTSAQMETIRQLFAEDRSKPSTEIFTVTHPAADDDFIDLDALIRNVAQSAYAEAVKEAQGDKTFTQEITKEVNYGQCQSQPG